MIDLRTTLVVEGQPYTLPRRANVANVQAGYPPESKVYALSL